MMLMCCDTGLGMASRRSVRYAQLPGDDDEDYADGGGRRDFDPRFDYTPKAFDRVPWKSIALAVFLLFLGCLLLLWRFSSSPVTWKGIALKAMLFLSLASLLSSLVRVG